MIIEMDDYLIVAEAPLYDERTQVLLAAIETRWPEKTVKYLLATHFHNDHIGGVRGFANSGATLIVGGYGGVSSYDEFVNQIESSL